MTISALNIFSVLQKRRSFGSASLTAFESEARQSTGPDVSAQGEAESPRLEGSRSFEKDEASGRLVFTG